MRVGKSGLPTGYMVALTRRMTDVRGLLQRLLPPRGIARTLAVQSCIYATGNGVFLAGSAVFFVHIVGLSPVQIGIGFSIAGAQAVLTSVPLGAVADRFGGQRAWIMGALGEALCFCAYPFVRGFWAFLAVLCALTLVGSIGNTGRSMYTIEVIPPADRVRVLAFSRAALNIGFSIGALGAGVALAINTRPAFIAMVLVNAAGLLVNTFIVRRMPRVERPAASPSSVRRGAGRFSVLRDRPFLAVTALNGLLLCQGTIFAEVMPLWVITHTDAKHVMLAILFITNTVMAVLLQVPASRGANTLPGIARLLRWAGWATAACGPVFYLSRFTSGPVTVSLLLTGVILVTGGELWQSAGGWGLTTNLPPAANRGAYLGAFQLGGQLQSMIGPAALTFLAIRTGGIGWLAISALLIGASAIAGPIVGWAGRTPRLGAAEPAASEPVAV
jgi:MFS family permease